MTGNRRTAMDVAGVWLWLLVSCLAVGWCVLYVFSPPLGDDLVYTSILRSFDSVGTGSYSMIDYPRYWARHWMFTNGRCGNMFLSFLPGIFPHWLIGVLCGLMIGVMYGMMLYFCRLLPSRGKGLAATAMIALVAFLFPWWDSFSYLAVSFNYIWTTVMALTVVLMLERADGPQLARVGRMKGLRNVFRTLGVALFCFLAGTAHEASSVPLFAGMAWMALMRGDLSFGGWRRISLPCRVMILSFFAGMVGVLFSPALIFRASSGGVADDVWWRLILKSAPLTLVLLVAMLIALAVPRYRGRLYAFMSGNGGFWAVSSILGLAIVAVGGIVGRSGWFSQVCAVIALWQWLMPFVRIKVNRMFAAACAAVLGIAAVAQIAGVDRYMYNGWKADTHVRELYSQSADGIVFFDMPDDCDVPLWAFSRVRYLRPEDEFTLYGLSQYYRKPEKLVLLPEAAREADWTAEVPFVDSAKGTCISSVPPAGTEFPAEAGWMGESMGRWTSPDGTGHRWVIPFTIDGRTLYYILPFRPRWGDRF